MQAPASTTASPNAAIANNTACKPLDEIRGLTRFEKDVNEVISLYFEDIIKRLRRPLLDVLRKSKKGFRPFVIRLLVLGVDESSAKPYIVVFCPAQVQDIVENYFRRDTPKRLCQPGKDGPASFDVIVEGTPIQLTTSHHVHPTSINTGHSPTERLRYRDTPLKIDGIHGIRYATMGGYVVVVGKDGRLSIYGLTAGHSIVQDNLEGEIESEQASGEPNAGQNLFPDLITYEPSQVLQSAANQTMHNATYSPFNDAQEEIEWSGTAMVAPASFSTQACDRDWALLEAIADQPGSGIQDSKIVERYFVGEPRFGTLLADDEAKISLQPAFIGKLSRHPSFAILSYGSDFVRVHTITTRDSHRIPAGTSGSWVTTEMTEPASSAPPQSPIADRTNEQMDRKITVFGQVVADDSLGDVYVVPLCDILNDVNHVLDARLARLPNSNSEINTILHMMNNTTITSSATTANDLATTGPLANEAEPAPEAPDRTNCTQCGSEDHTKEMCGMTDIHNSEGSAPTAQSAVTASYTPSMYTVSTGYSKSMVWYCSACGDGPIAPWQSVCVICSHEKCSMCTVEQTG